MTLLVVGFFIAKPYYDYHFKQYGLKNGQETVMIYIPSGASLEQVSDSIVAVSNLEHSEFLNFASFFEYSADKIEAGKYQLSNDDKIKSLIYGLKNGNQEVKDVKITFNNCRDIYDVAAKVAPSIEADSSEIVEHLEDPETLIKYGFKKETIPALFLPDTYEIGEWDMSAADFVSFMAEKYKDFWNNDRMAKAVELDLTQSEVTTVASIIEAEQGIAQQEWKTIAGLYLNRVRDNWKLESDPTFKFCWGDELDGVQRLLQKHREIDCPYNTYIYPGLPPGPIRIPSKKAIDAVLNAEEHNYYFMCAKPDNSGLHNFAETLAQHNRNARLWWAYANERGY